MELTAPGYTTTITSVTQLHVVRESDNCIALSASNQLCKTWDVAAWQEQRCLGTYLRNYFAEECLHVHTHVWVSILQVSQL